MGELICHLLGDFCFQSHRIALAKTRSWAWAALHVALYMPAFLALTRSPAALGVMAATHLVIDRYRLARHWVAFWGVGCEGVIMRRARDWRRARFIAAAGARGGAWFDEDNPPLPPAPEFLAVWLLILVDNSAHLLINHLAIAYL